MGRKYTVGRIWEVPDVKVFFPLNLFTRSKHRTRPVVIVENSSLNFDEKEKSILIAPLSSNMDEHHFYDIKLIPDEKNGLTKDSYIRMRAIQFISKSSLIKYLGKVSNDNINDILLTLNDYINCENE